MATKQDITITDDQLIYALAGRYALCKAASCDFDGDAQGFPPKSDAHGWMRRHADRHFEFSILLQEAILAIPASTVLSAAIQVRALKDIVDPDFELPSKDDRNYSRWTLLVNAGFESIAYALSCHLTPEEREHVNRGVVFGPGVRSHVTDIHEYVSAMLAGNPELAVVRGA